MNQFQEYLNAIKTLQNASPEFMGELRRLAFLSINAMMEKPGTVGVVKLTDEGAALTGESRDEKRFIINDLESLPDVHVQLRIGPKSFVTKDLVSWAGDMCCENEKLVLVRTAGNDKLPGLKFFSTDSQDYVFLRPEHYEVM